MLKPILLNILNAKSLITVQDNTMLKQELSHTSKQGV